MQRLLAAALMLIPATALAGDLKVRVQTNDRAILMTNQDTKPFTRCTVVVNNTYRKGTFDIAPGAVRDVWMTELVSSGSLRFDPTKERVERVHVLCLGGDALFAP